jgi:hypothetical protein
MPVQCEEIAQLLPQVVDGLEEADHRIIRHVESCLRCQAELAQYRRLLRVLHQLRTEVIEPAPGLVTEILAGLGEAGERGAIRSLLSGRRVAYIGGLAVAAGAAGAAGAIVLATRSHRRSARLAS